MTTFFQQSTWLAPLPVEFPMNDFLPPFPFDAEQGGWGTVDNIYCFGRYHLKQNEYLKIEFTSPDCCYWGCTNLELSHAVYGLQTLSSWFK